MSRMKIATTSKFRCYCGYTADSESAIVQHREYCEFVRIAYLGDIRRVANKLGRTPTIRDYAEHRCQLLPAWTTAGMSIFDSWNNAIIETGLTPTRRLHATIS